MIAYIIIHLICAFLAYGISLAYWVKNYPSSATESLCFSIVYSLIGGPIALLVAFAFTGGGFVHGFMIWPPKSTSIKDTQ